MRTLDPTAAKRGSLRRKLLEYFEENPDEELTRADIMTKFGVSATTTYKVLNGMGMSRELESVRVFRLPSNS